MTYTGSQTIALASLAIAASLILLALLFRWATKTTENRIRFIVGLVKADPQWGEAFDLMLKRQGFIIVAEYYLRDLEQRAVIPEIEDEC